MDEIAAGNVEWLKSGASIKKSDPAEAAEAGGTRGSERIAPEIRRAAARDAGRCAAGRRRVGPRDQVRRLSRARRDRRRRGPHLHPRAASTGPTSSARSSGRSSTCHSRSALIDGEVAVADKDGRTDFGALQDRIAEGKGRGIGYYMFDLLSLDGEDLRKKPLLERKAKLAALLADQPRDRAAVLLRPRRRQRRGDASACLRDQPRGHRLQARRRALPLRPHQGVAQGRSAASARSSSSSAGSRRT